MEQQPKSIERTPDEVEKGLEKLLNTRVSRRGFLKAVGLFALGVAASEGVGWYLHNANELKQDWEESGKYKTAEDFMEAHGNWLGNFEPGCTFSPAHQSWVHSKGCQSYDGHTPKPGMDESIGILTEVFGIDNIRLPIYIDQTVSRLADPRNPEVSLAKYEEVLTALRNHHARVVINGGLRAARWPEIHIQDELKKRIFGGKLPKGRQRVEVDSPMARFIFLFQERLYKELAGHYGDIVTAIQPENEYSTDFGAHPVLNPTDEYMLESLRLAHSFFPNLPLLVNTSASGGSLRETVKLLRNAVEQRVVPDKLLICGVDEYTRTPGSGTLNPVHGQNVMDTYILTQLFGIIYGSVQDNYDELARLGISLNFPEVQAEQWYDDKSSDPGLRMPGDSFRDYCFICLRLRRYFPNGLPPLGTFLGNWGVEEWIRDFVAGPTQDQTEMFKLSKLIRQEFNRRKSKQ